ncbi:MAG: hypothetical protein J6Z22_04940 [Lachnospiraceae bacterium]|nr:hypothetical protein [Lachnospiraceae bacterium]
MMLFDETGKYVGKIDIEDQNSWISAMGLSKNGTVVVSNINYGEQSSSASLCEIDFDGKKIGKTYKNFPFATGNAVMAPGIEGDILVSDGSAVYE